VKKTIADHEQTRRRKTSDGRSLGENIVVCIGDRRPKHGRAIHRARRLILEAIRRKQSGLLHVMP